jgi:hypothetical protein
MPDKRMKSKENPWFFVKLAVGAGFGVSKVNPAYIKVNIASILGAFYFQKS